MTKTVITGSSRGVGLELAKLLLEAGHEVWGISRSQTMIEHQNFIWCEFDLQNFTEYSSLHEKLPEHIDNLIHSAGIAYQAPLAALMPLDLNKHFLINAEVPALFTNSIGDRIEGSNIIILTTAFNAVQIPGLAPFVASKTALRELMVPIAHNLSAKLLEIVPHAVNSPMLKTIYPDSDMSEFLAPDVVALQILKLIETPGLETDKPYLITSSKLVDQIGQTASKSNVILIDR